MEEAKLKKAFAIVCILCMLVALNACSGSEPTAPEAPVYEEAAPKDFAIPLGDTGVKIVIPSDGGFETYESELNDFLGGNPGGTWKVIVNTEPKSDFPGCTLADYAALSAQANNGEVGQDADGNYYFTYTNEYSAEEIYKFYTAVREVEDQYYRIAFYCFDSSWEELGPQFADWSTTIEVE